MRALLLVLLLLPTAAIAQARLAPDDAALLRQGILRTADEFIAPAYAAHADAAAELARAVEDHCDGAEDMGRVRDAYAATFLAWQRASLIGIGPIAEAEGPMRVQLWPDPKSFAARAVRTALAAEDPALTAPGGLDGRSVALTGLTALWELTDAALAPGTYACDLAAEIARHQSALAARLTADWARGGAFREALATAPVEETVRALLAGLVVHVDRLRKFKLLRGLGAVPGEARAVRTEAHEAGLGLPSIGASFRALADLYDVPFGLFDAAPEIGGAMDYVVLAQGAGTVADTLAFEDRTLADIAEEDGEAAAMLRGLADTVLAHERYLKTAFPASIGLTSGFTAADGD